MPIGVNGSGTITGISVGGLPDGIVDTDMLAANAVTAAKASGGRSLTEADEWRITSNVSSSDGSLTANWERNDTLGYGHLGTGMSQSGGIWTFPQTGYWLIMYNATASHTDYDRRYVLNRIRGTTDNSNYDNLVDGYSNIMDVPSDATYATVHCTYIFDVTNTSLCKVSFHMQADGAVTWLGATDRRYTGVTFIRLGDT